MGLSIQWPEGPSHLHQAEHLFLQRWTRPPPVSWLQLTSSCSPHLLDLCSSPPHLVIQAANTQKKKKEILLLSSPRPRPQVPASWLENTTYPAACPSLIGTFRISAQILSHNAEVAQSKQAAHPDLQGGKNTCVFMTWVSHIDESFLSQLPASQVSAESLTCVIHV